MTKESGGSKSAANRTPQENATTVEPSGPKGDNPGTAGPDRGGPVPVDSETPENRLGHLNPSAPEDANTTPMTTTIK
jgi:hypothetical protein